MTKTFLLLTLSGLTFCGLAQNKKVEVLLIGTSHWANYSSRGSDVTQSKEIDILADNYQQELEDISNKITEFGPDKIFVERPVDFQSDLDSIYQRYQTTTWDEGQRNEIYQLGFRTAAKLNHERVYGADYRETSFPFDSLVKAMLAAEQFAMMKEFKQEQMRMEQADNALVNSGATLQEILSVKNSERARKQNFGWYLHGANRAGGMSNNIGSYLASEWIRRNTHIYGIIQKYVDETDDRIMILMGSGHVAVLANQISYHPTWEMVELKDLLEAK